MKLREITGFTTINYFYETMSVGNVASVPAAQGTMQKRNPDGTAKNALDQDSLFGTKPSKKPKKKKK